jgi:hypothetical protein
MRVSYNAVYTWLKTQADTCTLDQLNALDDLVGAAKTLVREKLANSQEALQKAEEAAKAAGYGSLDELLRFAKPEHAGTFAHVTRGPSGAQQRGPTRKCYMDPMDPNTPLYALFANRIPDALKPYLEHPDKTQRWQRHELHYENIAAARITRGLSKSNDAPYDPLQRYELLSREENAKPTRVRRIRKD